MTRYYFVSTQAMGNSMYMWLAFGAGVLTGAIAAWVTMVALALRAEIKGED